MKNFVQPGEVVSVAAPYAVASGAGLLIGNLFGIATTAAENGAAVEALIVGVVDIAKNSAEAWSVGSAIYWDDTAKVATIESDDNIPIGVAVAAASNPSSIGRVRLTGSTHFQPTVGG